MPRILIIDNDDYVRGWLRDVLIEARHEVGVAPNGRVGLRELNQRPADLVITEMLLPEMDGVETILALRRGHPGTKIIAVSAGGIVAAHSYLRLARALGVDRTLAKPFTQSELLDSI
ncbi:MAG TPA: response regulator, partial [Candidatus Binatia bacterium]|nr:response regulator [Candidatus Binatia bacterium]